MSEKTIKMPQNEQKTVKMNNDDVQKTIQIPKEGNSQPISYIDIGSVLNGKYKLTQLLTKNTSEAVLFICEADGVKYVAKIFLYGNEPKREVVEALKTIRQQNVIDLLDEGWQNDQYFEIMPYFSKGDLINALPLSEDYILNTVVPSVNEALHAIHEKNIVHRDIKPNNIFIDDDGKVVVGDFGISSVLKEGQQYRQTSQHFTISYAPPESFTGTSTYASKEFDYYTLGTTLLHLVTNEPPYRGMPDSQIITAIVNEPVPVPGYVSGEMKTLIQGLTVKDRNHRWGYEEVVRFLEGEKVDVYTNHFTQISLEPYIINGKTAKTPTELAVILTTEWDEGKKHLERQLLRKFTEQINNDILSKTMDCEKESNLDLGLFKLILHLNGGEFFSWKKNRYFDLQKLGEAVHLNLPGKEMRLVELLSTGALLYYAENYVNNNEFIERLKQLSNDAKQDSDGAYYKLCFLLHNNKEFKFEDQVFKNPDQLIMFLTNNKSKLNEYTEKLYDNAYFFAWLEAIGYGEHVSKWCSARS